MSNSPVTDPGYSAEYLQDGVYSITTTTRYNAAGQPLTSVQKQLISQLSPTIETKLALAAGSHSLCRHYEEGYIYYGPIRFYGVRRNGM